MRYFETEHERNSAKITALIVIILLLLFFIVGPTYLDPPHEYGVAVNFGTSKVGSGDIQPKEPIKSEPKQINETPPTEEASRSASAATENTEKTLTQDTEEAVLIRKQKEEAKAKQSAENKAKAEAERIAKEKEAAEKKIQQEKAEKKKKLDALIGGVSKSDGKATGGEGDDTQSGDKGQLNGNPYAPSYFGGAGPGKGGVGHGLGGRGKPTKKIIQHDCNEEGRVVVKITVNRMGKVISAVPGVKGTTNNSSCLLSPAKLTALSYKWPADSKAPAEQIGFVVIDFSFSQ